MVADRVPDGALGAEALGEPDVERLWDAVAHALRLDEPDPAASWNARLNELDQRTQMLDERAFKSLRYRGPGHRPQRRADPGGEVDGGP